MHYPTHRPRQPLFAAPGAERDFPHAARAAARGAVAAVLPGAHGRRRWTRSWTRSSGRAPRVMRRDAARRARAGSGSGSSAATPRSAWSGSATSDCRWRWPSPRPACRVIGVDADRAARPRFGARPEPDRGRAGRRSWRPLVQSRAPRDPRRRRSARATPTPSSSACRRRSASPRSPTSPSSWRRPTAVARDPPARHSWWCSSPRPIRARPRRCCCPRFEPRRARRSGEDFFLGFSPERIDPGQPHVAARATSPRSWAA